MGAFAYTQLPVRVGGQSFSPVTALMDAEFLPTLGNPSAMGTFFSVRSAAAATRRQLSATRSGSRRSAAIPVPSAVL